MRVFGGAVGGGRGGGYGVDSFCEGSGGWDVACSDGSGGFVSIDMNKSKSFSTIKQSRKGKDYRLMKHRWFPDS